MLEKSFDGHPWFGPSIMEIVKGIPSQQSTARTGQSHSIIELVLHMVSWRTFARQRLQFNNDFEVTSEANFPKPTTWEEALEKLRQSQAELVTAVKAFPDDKLAELVPSKNQRYTYYTLLHGIVQHDIYHAGQIQLILKSTQGPGSH